MSKNTAMLSAIVPSTRRPLSHFVGKTIDGIRREGFLPFQIEHVRAALTAVGLAIHDNEQLSPDEWNQDRQWNDVSYYNLAMQYVDSPTANAMGMPTDVQREVFDLSKQIRRQCEESSTR